MKPPRDDTEFLLRGMCFGLLFGLTAAALLVVGQDWNLPVGVLTWGCLAVITSVAMTTMMHSTLGHPRAWRSVAAELARELAKQKLVPFLAAWMALTTGALIAETQLSIALASAGGACLVVVYFKAWRRSA